MALLDEPDRADIADVHRAADQTTAARVLAALAFRLLVEKGHLEAPPTEWVEPHGFAYFPNAATARTRRPQGLKLRGEIALAWACARVGLCPHSGCFEPAERTTSYHRFAGASAAADVQEVERPASRRAPCCKIHSQRAWQRETDRLRHPIERFEALLQPTA